MDGESKRGVEMIFLCDDCFVKTEKIHEKISKYYPWTTVHCLICGLFIKGVGYDVHPDEVIHHIECLELFRYKKILEEITQVGEL